MSVRDRSHTHTTICIFCCWHKSMLLLYERIYHGFTIDLFVKNISAVKSVTWLGSKSKKCSSPVIAVFKKQQYSQSGKVKNSEFQSWSAIENRRSGIVCDDSWCRKIASGRKIFITRPVKILWLRFSQMEFYHILRKKWY